VNLRAFGPTFATEKLEERYNIKVSKETIRNIMIAEELWQGKKQKAKRRQWRERRQFRSNDSI
jgi:hypothetical protein